MLHAALRGELFGEGHQLAAEALAFVALCDVEAGEFGLLRLGVVVHGDARDELAIDLEHPVVVELREQIGARALHEFGVLDGRADEDEQRAHVLFEHAPDLLVVVAVDHRAHALGAEHLGKQRLVHVAVQQVDARDAVAAGACAVFELGK